MSLSPQFLPQALTVSVDAETALQEFDKFLKAWRESGSAAHAAEPAARPALTPYAPIGHAHHWQQWITNGWHGLGISLNDQDPTSMRDLIAVAELMGSHLVALPCIGTLMAYRVMEHVEHTEHAEHSRGREALAALRGEPSTPLTIAMPLDAEHSLIPFGNVAHALFPGQDGSWQLFRYDAAAAPGAIQHREVDNFAATLPLVTADRPVNDAHHAALKELMLLYVASTVGCADTCLKRAADYSHQREAYGRKIGSFQAVRHMLADMYRDVELARSGVIGASMEVDWLDLARHCTELTQRVVAQSIQVHGGIGFTWDAGLHFHMHHILAVRKLLFALHAKLTVSA